MSKKFKWSRSTMKQMKKLLRKSVDLSEKQAAKVAKKLIKMGKKESHFVKEKHSGIGLVLQRYLVRRKKVKPFKLLCKADLRWITGLMTGGEAVSPTGNDESGAETQERCDELLADLELAIGRLQDSAQAYADCQGSAQGGPEGGDEWVLPPEDETSEPGTSMPFEPIACLSEETDMMRESENCRSISSYIEANCGISFN